MIDFNSIEVVKFINAFSLNVTNDSKVTYKLIDPFGCEFTMNSSSITYKFTSEKESVFGLDVKKMNHVINSFKEFADYWMARQSFLEIQFNSEDKKKGMIKLYLR